MQQEMDIYRKNSLKHEIVFENAWCKWKEEAIFEQPKPEEKQKPG